MLGQRLLRQNPPKRKPLSLTNARNRGLNAYAVPSPRPAIVAMDVFGRLTALPQVHVTGVTAVEAPLLIPCQALESLLSFAGSSGPPSFFAGFQYLL